ncbi:MAG: response regulator [Candidatus Binataceae bacterium]
MGVSNSSGSVNSTGSANGGPGDPSAAVRLHHPMEAGVIAKATANPDTEAINTRWLLLMLRFGYLMAIVSQLGYIAGNYASAGAAHANPTLPYAAMGVAAALATVLASFARSFRRYWQLATMLLCLSLLPSWTISTVHLGQQMQLFVSCLLMLMTTAMLAPWGSTRQMLLTAACLVACAINAAMTPASPNLIYLWLYILTGSAVTLSANLLWTRWWSALDATHRQLRAEMASREEAQKKAQESEARLRKLLDANIDPVAVVRLSDEVYLYVNNQFLARHGYTSEEVIGKSAREAGLWVDVENLPAFRDRLKAEGSITNYEAEIRTKDGHIVPHLVSSVLVDLDGEPCVFSVARDITDLKKVHDNLLAAVAELTETKERLQAESERHLQIIAEREQAERRLRENEAKLRKIFEVSPESISINRMSDGRYIDVSKEMQTTGYGKDETLATSIPQMGIFANREQHRNFVNLLRAKGKVHNFEADFRMKDGNIVPCRISATMIELDGEPCVLSISSSIARLKRTERELIAAREAALAASRAKSEFLSSMSHEIRTPMNAILGMADLLAESPLTPEQRRYVTSMTNNGNALLDLINGILDLAKVESGRLHLEQADFDLDELVERVGETLSVRAHEKRLELATRILPDVPLRLVGDALRLRQVLINLVGNAIKFTENGEVLLIVDAESAPNGEHTVHLRFSVRDTGIGIPQDKLEAIFQSFTQADSSTTRKYGGSGLGLSIARRLVDLMGGAIRAESTPGRGSTFCFTAGFGLAERPRTGLDEAPEITGMRILVVDDNATNRLILKEILSSRGAEVAECGSGEQALAEVERAYSAATPYRLLLLDCRMPGMNGFELVARLRRRPAGRNPVVMMLTSEDLNPKLVRLKELGINSYLIKPIRRSDLLQAIATALGTARAVPQIPAQPLTPAANGDAGERPLRILLAEDSPDNRLLIEALLRKPPFHLELADNGAIALSKVMRGRYDLVLMDMQMPVMDGYTAVRKIREWEREQGRAPLPIVALTASVLEQDIRSSLEAGCTMHVSKPVKKSLLINTIRELTSSAPQSGGNGDKIVVEVDPDLSELVPDFLARKRTDLDALTGALGRGDFDTIASIGHRIKGEGGGFGFQPISEIGLALEQAGGSRDAATTERHLQALSNYLDHVEVRFADSADHGQP